MTDSQAPELNRAGRREAARRRAALGSAAVLATSFAAAGIVLGDGPASATGFTVSSCADSGANSLRAAILSANGNGVGTADTITIATTCSGATKVNVATKFNVTGPITIVGPADPADFVLDGAGNYGTIFALNGNIAVDVSGITIQNNVNNENYYGGGFYVNMADLTVDNCVFTNNSNPYNSAGRGGAIQTGAGGGTVTVSNSTFEGNSASKGAAIAMLGTGHLTVTSSLFTGNVGAEVIADNFFGDSTNPDIIANTTITGNTGTALNFENSYDEVYLMFDTITSNTGAGVRIQGTRRAVHINYSIIADNTVAAVVNPNNYATVTATSSRSIISGTIDNSPSGTFARSGTDLNVSPNLAALAANGGPTRTQALNVGSPAIDAGPTVVSQVFPGKAYDQRGTGYNRIVNTNADLGAFEVQSGVPGSTTTSTSTPGSTTTSTSTPASTTTSTSTPASTTTSTPASTTTTTSPASPPPPTGINATQPPAGSRTTVVSWTPPASGATPTGYQVRCMPVGTDYDTGPTDAVKYVGTTNTTIPVGDLVGGRLYHCLVTARYGPDWFSWKGDGNEGPKSAWSTTITVPVTRPVAPTKVTATTPDLPSGRSTQVRFTTPTNNSGAAIIDHTVTCTSSDGGTTRTATGAASPVTVADLTPGKTYTCTVTSRNSQGSSNPSGPSTAFVVPGGAPTNVAASAPTKVSGKWRTTVTFTRPNGGPTVTGYRVTCTPSGGGTPVTVTTSTTTTTIWVDGLVRNKTYTCTVAVRSGSTTGPASAASNPVTVPNA